MRMIQSELSDRPKQESFSQKLFTWKRAGVFLCLSVLLVFAAPSLYRMFPQVLGDTVVVTPKLVFGGESSEFSSLSTGATITPKTGPQGQLVVRGSGQISLLAATTGTGMRFLNTGQQNTDVAFTQFTGSALSDVFSTANGEISFSLTSKLTPAERADSSQKHRYVYDAYDSSGQEPFYFLIDKYDNGQPGVVFQYRTASQERFDYYVPQAQLDSLFGKNVTIRVKLTWNNGTTKLYINDVLAQTTSYTAMNPNWGTGSSLVIGAQGYGSFGAGFFALDDVIDEFTVSQVTGTSATPTSQSTQTQPSPNATPTQTTAPSQSASGNGIVITEQEGKSTANYPVQMGRAFAKGEIATAPAAMVDGTVVATQADVKLRWDDGSVKYAVIAFLIPQLNAGASVKVNFQNQSNPNNTAPTATALLAANYDFDAIISLTNGGVTKSASARTMLQNGDFTYWTKGPIATTIILADHSANRKYDLGFDSYKPFRPIYIATFWPAKNAVTVRYIGEIANTESLEDITYNLNLTLGKTSPKGVYTKSNFTHRAQTRWTKEFSLGAVPSKIAINHNLAYLQTTKLIPAYDTTKQYSSAVLQNAYSGWQSANKDLGDSGTMQKYMGSAGGREDIGMYPAWVVRWFYSGDPRAEEQALGNADLGGAFPMHIREGVSTKYFNRGKTVSALGRVISVAARPTIYLFHPENSGISSQDKINYVGPVTDGGFSPDNAHQPELYSIPYLFTGDYWYLEQLQFWSAWTAATQSGGTDVFWGRGPTGAEGGMHDQVRGEAWGLRTRMLAAVLSPDGSAEKDYFTTLTNDLLAMWEGERNVTGTGFANNSMWNWGRTVGSAQFPGSQPSPLRAWISGSDRAVASGGLLSNITSSATAPWEHYFLLSSLGRGQELGFQTAALLSWLGQFLTDQVSDSGYNPNLTAVYQMPVLNTSGQWFTKWSDVKTGFSSDVLSNPAKVFTDTLQDPDGYAYYARGAATFLTSSSAGLAAYNSLNQMVGAAPNAWNTDLKWAIQPRVAVSVTPAPTVQTPAPTTGTGGTTVGTQPTTQTPTTGTGQETPTTTNPTPTDTSNPTGTTVTPVNAPEPTTPRYITGSLIKERDGTVYMIAGQNKKAFASATVFRAMGYTFSQVTPGDTSDYTLNYIIKNTSVGHPWGGWVRDGRLYYFVHETGMIPIPLWSIFMSFTQNKVPVPYMISSDKAILRKAPNLEPLSYPDERVY